MVFELFGVKVDLGHPLITPEVAKAFREGRFEQSEVRITRTALKPGASIIEIGTCTGFVAMQAALIVGAKKIRCFEANPAAAEFARSNFALNGLDIDLRNCVLMPREKAGKVPRAVPFFVADQLNSSSLRARRDATKLEVQVEVFEDHIEAFAADTIIMDIEGAEIDILPHTDLKGIRCIIMETHYRKVGRERTDEMIADLYSKGFRINVDASVSGVLLLTRDI